MTVLTAGASAPALFDGVTVNSAIDGSQTGLDGNLDVIVTGYGIQADGLASAVPADVWSDGQF